jgi:hypothetical protein
VGGGQRALESLALFSPKLLRSTIALFADASRPWTPQGAAAAHTILKMSAATAGIFSLAAMMTGEANGEAEEEIVQRVRDTVNPLSGKKFLSVEIDGDWYGVGGQIRAMTQMVAGAIGGGINFAKDGTITDAADNPIIPMLKLLSSRTSPAYRAGEAAIELATQEELNLLPFDEIDNVPDLLFFVGRSSLPFVIQDALEMGQDPLRDVSPGPLAAAVLGGRTSPLFPSERRDDIAADQYGVTRYRELTPEQKRELNDAHPELVEAIKNSASKEEKQYNAEIDRTNKLATDTLGAIATDYTAGKYTERAKMREDIEDAMSARSIRLDTVRSSFGKDFDFENDTDVSNVLNAYYRNFELARRNPEDPASPINFDVLDQLQATFNREVENEVFGDPNRVKQILAERTSFKPPAELDWFFANKKLVQDVGYWDAKDRAFKQVEADIGREFILRGIYSAGELMARAIQLEDAGDMEGAALARGYMRAIDRISSAEHRQMRATHPNLDRALLQNGYITKRITEDTELNEGD